MNKSPSLLKEESSKRSNVNNNKNGNYSIDLQNLLDDTNKLIEATEEENMGDIVELRNKLEKLQFDSVLIVDKLVNYQAPDKNDRAISFAEEMENIPGDQLEYVVYDKFKAKSVPEYVLFEQWELEERKIKEKAMILREKQKEREAHKKQELEKLNRMPKEQREKFLKRREERQKEQLRLKKMKKKKKPIRPRMVQMCADAMDPWERMALREKKRKKKLWRKKVSRDKAAAKEKLRNSISDKNNNNNNKNNRPSTAKAQEVDEEMIEIDLFDDLIRKDASGKVAIKPPKEFLSAVNKIMEQVDIKWEDRLHSLLRASRTSQMSYNDFIDCIIDLQVRLTSEEIIACYQYLGLDMHGHMMLDRPSEAGGGFSKEHKQRIADYQSQLNNQKTERAMFARQYQFAHRYVKVQNYRSRMNRASICRINELEGQLERLSHVGLTVDIFREAMRKARECFRYSPRAGKNIKEFLRKFDYDGDGTISKEEFRIAMNEINADLTEKELQSCFAYLDPEQTGEVDYNEFVYVFYNRRSMRHKVSLESKNDITIHPTSPLGHKKGTMKHRKELEEELQEHRKKLQGLMITDGRSETHKNFNECMKKIEQQVSANKHDIEQTFNDIDTDRSGSITREEFITCLEGMDVNLNENELNVLFHHLDPSGDNRITLGEFSYMYFNRRRMTNLV